MVVRTIGHPRRNIVTCLGVLLALSGFALVGAVPARATIFERGTFSFAESVEEDLCGIAARRDSVAAGKFRNRTGKGDLDQAFFGRDRVSSSLTRSPTSPLARTLRSPATS